jgi:hypothetical protein
VPFSPHFAQRKKVPFFAKNFAKNRLDPRFRCLVFVRGARAFSLCSFKKHMNSLKYYLLFFKIFM